MAENDDRATDQGPRTIGELRRRLAELGNPWRVDPTLSDDEPLPDPPRGGADPLPGVAERLTAATPTADTDILALIAERPPANPLMRERWVEQGLLDADRSGGESS